MVCFGSGESPGMPLHLFESSSPICGWCLWLNRQRDDVRSSRTATIFFKKTLDNLHRMCYNKDNEGQSWKITHLVRGKQPMSKHHQKTSKKKFKNLLTNEVKYGIINTTNKGGDQHQRL